MPKPRIGPTIVALFMMFPLLLGAQTFNGVGAGIPDDGNSLEIPLNVMGLTQLLDTTSFGLEQVCINIDHDWISDLDVSIVAPDGTARSLVSGQGGSSDHYTNTCFRADASELIGQGTPPYSGTYRPQSDLGIINNGQTGNGEWKLRVLDAYPFADAGSVLSWNITFGTDPASPFNLLSSNLPIVVINTNGQAIPDDPKIMAEMGIIDNGAGNMNHPSDPFNNYNGHIGIERRGNSSNHSALKKSYSIELWDESGLDVEASILGMPAESDWILLANYFDKSLMNNTLTFHLSRAMGNYAPRQRFVEVLLNGEYVGVYALVEKIKRGSERVNIAKLQPDEISGDDLTGGYILGVERDSGPENGFTSNFAPAENGNGQYTFLEYRYPKPENIASAQRDYIQTFIETFETALAGSEFTDPATGYQAFADLSSFVDMFLINEFSHNVDGYRLSSYLYKHKDSDGGKLHAGPAWDYDLAWGNADYCHGSYSSGWVYEFGNVCPEDNNQVPFWWSRLQEDTTFVNAVLCRWNELRDNVLSPSYVAAYCDSVAALLDEAQQRNFTVWPILGQYVWPNPEPIPTTYAGEVLELKNYMTARWAWMDNNLPGILNCSSIGIAEVPNSAIEAPFPNPFVDHLNFRTIVNEEVIVTLRDALGRVVHQAGPLSGRGKLHRITVPSNLASGTYVLTAVSKGGAFSAFRLER